MKPSSRLVFALAVMGVIGGWFIGFQHWSDMAAPQAIGGLFVSMASVLGAALGVHTTPLATSTTTTSAPQNEPAPIAPKENA